ncbi:MAG: bifunctional ADP-heptose synthase [Chloroflexota bacterium]
MVAHLHTLPAQLAGRRVLVIGDVILDEYLIGNATRMSREAPIPVLEFRERRHIPGGAANPAANIAALGGDAVQIGVVGADAAADHLKNALAARGIRTAALITDAARPTTLKMRVMAHMGLRFPQQVARMDTLSREPVPDAVAAQILVQVEAHIAGADALLLSDYRAGMLTPGLVARVREIARARGILLTADAQGNFDKYAGFALVKCNAAEAATALERPLHSDDDFATAARTLYEQLSLTGGMVITRGGDGATLATADGAVHHCPAPSVTDVFDTVGAGDTAIAVMTLALCAGATYPDAVTLANYASGLVVRRVGNYAPNADELRRALETLTPLT